MKSNIIKLFSLSGIILFLMLLVAFHPSTEYPNKESLLMDVFLQSLQYNHYAPSDIDDEISLRLHDMYLKRIDFGKRFFIQEDIDYFNQHKYRLDDYALQRDFSFFDSLHIIRDKRIEYVRGIYNKILSSPFDYEKDEFIETNSDKIEYVQTEEDLKRRWTKILKYRSMIELRSKLDRQEKAIEKQDTSVEIKSYDELEALSRDRIKKQFDRWFNDLEKEDREDRIADYLNTLANVLEPHTGYFPPLEKENFNIRISGKLEGIGAQLVSEDGYVKVVRIVPGSASWRQGELGVNDLIIKVAQKDKEAIDVVDMKLDDVLPMIRGEKGTIVRLTVKKPDGTTKEIQIERDVVVLEESYAKSAIIDLKKSNTKVGLINLRSFYADFKDPRGRRCSRDVKKEVQKLISEQVDGIVIDLRFNGGGSLRDVVEMSGLFIESGPIVQVKGRDSRPYPLEDRDPSVLYDGPLVILVNSYSASASEIMAAALQDYGRAIIVGTAPSTFGKGTVQRFFNLDAVVPSRFKSFGELGSIKITIQKFFRINGGSTQLLGVTPDIILPGPYSHQEIGEKEEDFPMNWSEVNEIPFEMHAIKKMDKIKKKSEKRVEQNNTIQLLEKRSKWTKELRENSYYTLNMDLYLREQNRLDSIADTFNAISKEISTFNVHLLEADQSQYKDDTLKLESMENWFKSLKKDPYIEEVAQIINDWR